MNVLTKIAQAKYCRNGKQVLSSKIVLQWPKTPVPAPHKDKQVKSSLTYKKNTFKLF